jgi:hypothetical protein
MRFSTDRFSNGAIQTTSTMISSLQTARYTTHCTRVQHASTHVHKMRTQLHIVAHVRMHTRARVHKFVHESAHACNKHARTRARMLCAHPRMIHPMILRMGADPWPSSLSRHSHA